ncbi:MAG: hypothetical protein NTU82_01870 [Actinobacteria bacterium]|nr:hypothetical protein [Actinomycetota bacterium]
MKRSITTQVSSVLRIVRGERDALVRTTHFKAAVENVSIATIERTIMSTKTTFKRVALVAVAAVGLGLLTAVPSGAPGVFYSNGLTAGTVVNLDSQVVGGNVTVIALLDTTTASDTTINFASSGVGTVTSAGTPTTGGSTTWAAATPQSWSDSTSSYGAANGPTQTITLTSAVAGTQVITMTPLNSDGSPGTARTKNIYWVAAAINGVLNHSTGFINTDITAAPEATTGSTATASRVAASTFSSTAVARIAIDQYASTDTTTALLAANTKAVSVTISGAGAVDTVAGAGASRGAVATVAAAASVVTSLRGSVAGFLIYPDGRTGTATITTSVDGVTLNTWTYAFTGAVASYGNDTAGDDTRKTSIGIGSMVSSAPLIASVPASSSGAGANVTVTGVAAGTAEISVCNTSLCTAATKILKFTVTVGKVTAKTVTLSFDKASYAPGEKMTLTVKAVGSDGTAVGDGTYNLFKSTGIALNSAVVGAPAAAAAVVIGGTTAGVKTYTLYAPLVSGDVTATATEGTDTDNVIAAGTAATLSATASVSGGAADAALDAANEATDAANYAADAADAATTAAEEATAAATAAQDSADAALAAVTDLGLKVTSLVSALRAQITALTNIIVKIQKKVKA